MEKESIGERGMGVRYKGSQGQTKRTVELQEEEEMSVVTQLYFQIVEENNYMFGPFLCGPSSG
jgi:hypothetical protein